MHPVDHHQASRPAEAAFAGDLGGDTEAEGALHGVFRQERRIRREPSARAVILTPRMLVNGTGKLMLSIRMCFGSTSLPFFANRESIASTMKLDAGAKRRDGRHPAPAARSSTGC